MVVQARSSLPETDNNRRNSRNLGDFNAQPCRRVDTFADGRGKDHLLRLGVAEFAANKICAQDASFLLCGRRLVIRRWLFPLFISSFFQGNNFLNTSPVLSLQSMVVGRHSHLNAHGFPLHLLGCRQVTWLMTHLLVLTGTHVVWSSGEDVH